MIKRLEINGVHLKIDKKLHDYAEKKIGKLDHYLSKHSRESAHATIMLKETRAKDKKQATCEVIMHLPNESLTVQETTMNMFAAIDIVETRLKNLLKKYKETHERRYKLHRRFIARLRRSSQPTGE